MKINKAEKYTTEWCQYCETEVQLPNAKGIFECPNCHKLIIACSACEKMNCAECELNKGTDFLRKGFGLSDELRQKEEECEELKKTVMTKCPQCGEYLSPVGLELYEKINNYKQALEGVEKIAKEYQSYNRSGFEDILQIIQKVKGE